MTDKQIQELYELREYYLDEYEKAPEMEEKGRKYYVFFIRGQIASINQVFRTLGLPLERRIANDGCWLNIL